MSIAIKPHSDEEVFNYEMGKAFDRLDAHIMAVPLTTEDVVTDRAEKDAARILKGTSSYSAMAPFRNLMRAGNKIPDSSYYRCGGKFYHLYCRTVEKVVKASNPERQLNFPEWKE